MAELITDDGRVLTTDDLTALVTRGIHGAIDARITMLLEELSASRSEIRKAQIDRAVWELIQLRREL